MFGHQDTNDQTTQSDAPAVSSPGITDVASAPAVEPSEVDEALKALAAHATPDNEPALTPVTDSAAASAASSAAETEPVTEPRDESAAAGGAGADHSQLLDLKQSALQQLTPLIDKLDQTAEERFRTSMMMIQAADNQSLLPTAYEAAQQIEDEKVKAQALLDIVNEINYFTQQTSDSEA